MLHQDLKLNPNLLYLAKRIQLAKNLWGCKKQEKDKTTYWIGIRIIIAHLQKPLRPGWWMLWTLVKVSFKTMLKWAIRHQSRPLTACPLCTSCTPAHINSSNETEGTPQDRNSSSSVLTGDLVSHFQCFYQLPVIFTLDAQMKTSGKAVGPCGHNNDPVNAESTGAQGMSGRETLGAPEYCSDSQFVHAELEQTQS